MRVNNETWYEPTEHMFRIRSPDEVNRPIHDMMFTLALVTLRTQVGNCGIPCFREYPLKSLRLTQLLLARLGEIVNQSSLVLHIHIALKMGAAVLLLTISLLLETLELSSTPSAFFSVALV